jgi:uncharacterized protein (DUF885 family)
MKLEAFEDQIEKFLEDDPNFCIFNGLSKHLSDLPDPGKNKRIANTDKIKSFQNLLNDIDNHSLTSDQKIDLRLYELLLDQKHLSYELDLNGVPHNMRMPIASETISGPLFMLFINDPRDAEPRLVNIISRLEKVDGYISSYMRNIKDPVERWVQMELEKVSGLADFFENIYKWAQEVGFQNTDRLRKAITSANSSFFCYETHLKNTTISKDIFIGEKQMLLVLKSRGIDLSPTEIHQIAKDFVTDNLRCVEELRVKLIQKYDLDRDLSADDLQKHLTAKFTVPRSGNGFDYILSRYQVEREKILTFIKDRDLFPVMEKQDMHIMQTPSFMVPSIPAGAMMPPLPLRSGIKKSLVYLTLSDDLIPEHTEISIPGMMIHEGIPGHHLQLAWAASNKSFIRNIFEANDLFEGWTTMLEDYMLDIGYASELADEVRFIGKRDISRIGARVAIDLYFMSGDKKYLDIGIECDLSSEDPFISAGNLLQTITGFVDARVQGELNWYSQERGYPLSYLTGNYLVWNLKAKFKAQFTGSDIECDREFHKRFLEAGNMPVSILEDVVLKK